MPIPQATRRWIALIALGVLAGAICWLMAIQAFMVLLHSFGTWQRPGIARVTILRIDQDDQNMFTNYIQVKEGEKDRTLCMLKEESEDAKVGDEIWILDNYYATPLRPAQFRLTPQRLLVEYPQPLLLLTLLGIWRIRRAQVRELKQPPSQERRRLTDDFHARAHRFASTDAPSDVQDPPSGPNPPKDL